MFFAMEVCPDCKIALPKNDSLSHVYLGASPSCWALYGELLAREYNDPAYMTAHRMTVDAYCAQHPGKPERRTIQSINVHLVGLFLTVERDTSGDFARNAIGTLIENYADRFQWLNPPSSLGDMNVQDILAAKDACSHQRLARQWAASVWQAWSSYHDHIRTLAELVI
jgi:hypothetical protein